MGIYKGRNGWYSDGRISKEFYYMRPIFSFLFILIFALLILVILSIFIVILTDFSDNQIFNFLSYPIFLFSISLYCLDFFQYLMRTTLDTLEEANIFFKIIKVISNSIFIWIFYICLNLFFVFMNFYNDNYKFFLNNFLEISLVVKIWAYIFLIEIILFILSFFENIKSYLRNIINKIMKKCNIEHLIEIVN